MKDEKEEKEAKSDYIEVSEIPGMHEPANYLNIIQETIKEIKGLNNMLNDALTIISG
jgi:hypothetical protein